MRSRPGNGALIVLGGTAAVLTGLSVVLSRKANASVGTSKGQVVLPAGDDSDVSRGSPPATGGRVVFSQKEIVDAIEAAIAGGNVTPLAELTRLLGRMPLPLQAYVAAAGRRAQAYHLDIVQWSREFDRREKEKAAGIEQKAKYAEDVTAVVATAVNAIPVVGQALSACIGVGLAMAKAVRAGEKIPTRSAADQVRPAYEGRNTFRGLSVTELVNPYDDPYLLLKQAVAQDPVALALPNVPYNADFMWAPNYADFVEAAHEMKLYPEDAGYTQDATSSATPDPVPAAVNPELAVWEGRLLRSTAGGAVYLIQAGARRWVVNETVLNEKFGGWANVQDVSQGVLSQFPYGQNVK